jgi:hypothetical protein
MLHLERALNQFTFLFPQWRSGWFRRLSSPTMVAGATIECARAEGSLINTVEKLGFALCLGIAEISLLHVRHATFYSYHVDRPAEAQYSADHAGIFGLAGLTCMGLAVALVRGAYKPSLRR